MGVVLANQQSHNKQCSLRQFAVYPEAVLEGGYFSSWFPLPGSHEGKLRDGTRWRSGVWHAASLKGGVGWSLYV